MKKNLPSTKTNKQKRDLLSAMESSLGVVSNACEKVGMSRTTHYEWMKDDPEYRAKVNELSNKALDFAESKLHELIKRGNTAAVIFYLKTKGKERGYVERQEVRVEQEKPDLSGYTTDQLLDLVSSSKLGQGD